MTLKANTHKRLRVRKSFNLPTKTKQQFKDECDINALVRRAVLNGSIHQPVTAGSYGDFATSEDYHSAVNRITEANAQFQELPSDLRARLANDPGELLRFIDDPDNLDEAVQLGLLELTDDEVRRRAEVVTPPTTTPPENTPPTPPESGE